MWGTLSPDQRPTDLGANDAGFVYRGTDVQRTYVWSGTVWIETTSQWTAGTAGAIYYNAGNVGIGDATPGAPLSFGTGIGDKIFLYDAVSNDYGFGIQPGVLQIYSSSTARVGIGYGASAGFNEVLTVASNGGVGINQPSPTYHLHMSVDSAAKPTTSTWTIASDRRLKQNIRPLEGGLPVISQLNPVEAEYNGLAETPRGQRIVSFLADELMKVLPATVSWHPAKLQPADGAETMVLDINIHEVLMHLVLAVQQISRRLGL
jgi:hypothetical protein